MRPTLLFSFLLLLACNTVSERKAPSDSNRHCSDQGCSRPFLWLEEVEGDKALAWVHEQNDQSLPVFQKDARYNRFLNDADTILNAKDKIPYGALRGGHVYIFGKTIQTFVACGVGPPSMIIETPILHGT